MIGSSNMDARCNTLFSGLDYFSIQAAANQFQATRPAHLTSMRYHPQNQGLNAHYGLAHASERDRDFRESISNFEPHILHRQFSPQLVQHVPHQQHHFMHHTSGVVHEHNSGVVPHQYCHQQRYAHYQGCEAPSLNFRHLARMPAVTESATRRKDSSQGEQKKMGRGLQPFVSPYQLIPFPEGLADDVLQQLKMTPRAPSGHVIAAASAAGSPTKTAVSQGAEHRAQKGGGAACIDQAAEKPQRGGPQWQYDPNQQPQHKKLTAHTLSPVLESGRSPLFLSDDYRCASWSEAAGLPVHACHAARFQQHKIYDEQDLIYFYDLAGV